MMLTANLEVLVLDLSAIVNPELKTGHVYRFHGYHEISSRDDFKNILKQKKLKGVAIVLMPVKFKLISYFFQLWKSDLLLAQIRLGSLPSSATSQLRSWRWGYIFNYLETPILNKICKILKLSRPMDLTIAAGAIALKNATTKETLSVCSLDYNVFIEHPSLGLEDHIVFLDENEPFHSDYDRLGLEKISAPNYFAALNHFFDVIEKKYGKKVVIAAHPTSGRDYAQFFSGRTVIKGKTVELVRDSYAVIAHTSTSIQMAFLYNKRTCFVLTDIMFDGFRKGVVDAYTQYGFVFHNISKNLDSDTDFFKSDFELARRYVNDFVKSDDVAHVMNWKILIDYLGEKS